MRLHVSKLAKNYFIKKYIDISADKNINSENLKGYLNELTEKKLEKSVKALSSNPFFKDIVKKNPDNWYAEWQNVEKKMELLTDRMEEDFLKMKYDNKRLDLQDNGEVKNDPATLEEYVAYYDSAKKKADENNVDDNLSRVRESRGRSAV